MSFGEEDRRWIRRRMHFIGIGGAGMSGLAQICHELGADVTGSDRSESSYIERLRLREVYPCIGHDAANLPDDAEVVVSTAIGDDNPELALARERGMRVRHRGEVLAELCESRRLIAVAGTHGKTTTAAMVAWALRWLGAEPTFAIGGEVPGLGIWPEEKAANAGWGMGPWMIVEADESDASFLALEPEIAVVTNIELDHHSRWGSEAELRGAFAEFAAQAEGVVLPAGERLGRELEDGDRGLLTFDVDSPGPESLDLDVPGRHNLLNARAAIAAAALAGFDPGEVAEALSGFAGVRRRLEFKGVRDGATIYDDYAHHPTELRAALGALRELTPERLVVAFQPHLYSRTKALAEQFGAALALADEVVVLDVYAAREQPTGELAGVGGLDVARAAADRMGGRRVVWAPTLERAGEALSPRLRPGFVVATIGAGDVHRVGERLLEDGGEG